MNIFDYAKEYNADYYDPTKCLIYKVQDYNNRKKQEESNSNIGIEVVDLDGNTVGFVYDKK